MSAPARRLFNQLVFEGTVFGPRDEGRETPVLWDLCRCFHPERVGMNTCWDTKRNTRPANNGSRIDYILCTDGIKDWFTSSNIQEGLMGSDHCPVFAGLADEVTRDGETRALAELMNPPGVFQDKRRLRELGQKDLLPLSARLIAEFDRRQSIRDMFTKKANPPSSTDASPSSNPSGRSGDHHLPTQTFSAPSTDQNSAYVAPQQKPALANSTNTKSASQPKPKRLADTPNKAPPRALKRAKSSSNSAEPKNKAVPGQRTLQGFFKPKAAPASQSDKPLASPTGNSTQLSTKVPRKDASSQRQVPLTQPRGQHPEKQQAPLERVFDPIEAKESWSKLLGKRTLPRCEHNEPCISLTTKKPGVNCGKWTHFSSAILSLMSCSGRSFYICPRPLGPSGEKEKGSEWRCGTFIWSSDWNGL